MSDDTAIAGTRRSFKEMADGTIRLQVDIDPCFKTRFFDLFPDIDMPVALVALKADFEQQDNEPDPVNVQQENARRIPSAPATSRHPYGNYAKTLKQSGFFRAKEVWMAVGTDKDFLEWLRGQPCMLKGHGCAGDVVPAHVRFIENGSGTGIKPVFSAIPLCDAHHQMQHQHGYSSLFPVSDIKSEEELRDRVATLRVKYLESWVWEATKDQLGYESMGDIPPDEFREWAEGRGIGRYLPEAYR